MSILVQFADVCTHATPFKARRKCSCGKSVAITKGGRLHKHICQPILAKWIDLLLERDPQCYDVLRVIAFDDTKSSSLRVKQLSDVVIQTLACHTGSISDVGS